ncbi:PREDICTED: bromodomain adjacent to zinc finger domain protein 1A-like [Priapulus caudatus]|uniref:Bromodomain adjacent to zinc finger domain protein 1A-like n=1 Tax=Priapulus caudatus TaxID=37621 RepID=A0ABM1EVF1_PRICU|nr:PREDICTED: bromodomain adjacent to zinc finger domain protein 1A-like [Priapulus caudatus]
MPLLRRQPFVKQKPPEDLGADEEVFFCELTKEVFRDYEEFFERTILYNSLVWSCSLTGRPNLTYQEALECETRARRNLAAFPEYLQRPILFLASLTRRGRLNDMCDDIYLFSKERFFIGERVEVVHGGERLTCQVLNVYQSSLDASGINGHENDHMNTSGSSEEGAKSFGASPESYTYCVQEIGTDDNPFTIDALNISRKKGVLTRDKNKLYLKLHCRPDNGLWKVKPKFVEKFRLAEMTFASVFCGAPPKFSLSPAKRVVGQHQSNAVPGVSSNRSKAMDAKRREEQRLEIEQIARKQDQEQLEKERIQMIRDAMKLKQKLAEEKEFQREKRRQEMELDRQKKKEERDNQREQKRLKAEYMKEWSKPRDDLCCNDLKDLPQPTEIQTVVSSSLFGDIVAVLEFLQAFGSIYHVSDVFPDGISFSMLEQGLADRDPQGFFGDLLQFLLSAIFIEQEEEWQSAGAEKSSQAVDMSESYGNGDVEAAINEATMAAAWSRQFHGAKLGSLTMDTYTVTEVLRLHLMAAGARQTQSITRYQFQQRCGYCPKDDPGLEFKMAEPGIMEALSTGSVFDLSASDRLKILHVLIGQLLTYTAIRDVIEDNMEKLRQLKYELRHLQWAEQRKEKEEQQARFHKKREEKRKEREKLEELRAKKLKTREDQLKSEETVSVGSSEVNSEIELSDDDEDDNGGDRPSTRRSEKQEEALIEKLVQRSAYNNEEIDEESLTPKQRGMLQQRRADDEAQRKMVVLRKEQSMASDVLKLQQGSAIFPLGRDRSYRRYWLFMGVAGLFVDDDEREIGRCLAQPTPTGRDVSDSFLNNNIPASVVNKRLQGIIAEERGFHGASNPISRTSSASSLTDLSAQVVSVADLTAQPPSVASADSGRSSVDSDIEIVCVMKPGDAGAPPGVTAPDDGKMAASGSAEVDPCAAEVDLCTADAATCLVHGAGRAVAPWTLYPSVDNYEQLMGALNARGYREGTLRDALQTEKTRVVASMMRCDTDALMSAVLPSSSQKCDKQRRSKEPSKYGAAENLLEVQLCDMILDMEERIYAGTLGYMRSVEDRLAWRVDIQEGKVKMNGAWHDEDDATCNGGADDGGLMEATHDDDGERERTREVVTRLASALVQVAQGVEPRYLKPPLGGDDSRKQKQKKLVEEGEGDAVVSAQTDLFQRWQESLLEATSLARVFLHLATLDSSIIWSKSVLNARCRLCRRKSDPDKMLLCDRCDRGHHMYCLKPKVKAIPTGEWFCPECKPKEARSPRKQRKLVVEEEEEEKEEEEEEEEEDEECDEEEEEEESDDDDEGEEEPEDSMDQSGDEEIVDSDAQGEDCAVCDRGGGKLVSCSRCSLSYHASCCVPRLRQMPKHGRWTCHMCKPTRNAGIKLRGMKTVESSRSTPDSDGWQEKKQGRRRAEERAGAGSRAARTLQKSRSMNDRDTARPSRYRNVSEEGIIFTAFFGQERSKGKSSACLFGAFVVPDYYRVIKCPMDFSTMRGKFREFEYARPAEFLRDLHLVLTNCTQYNQSISAEARAGQRLSRYVERQLRERGLDGSADGLPSKRTRQSL